MDGVATVRQPRLSGGVLAGAGVRRVPRAHRRSDRTALARRSGARPSILRVLCFTGILLLAAGAVAVSLIVLMVLSELANCRPTPLPRRIRALGRWKRRELRKRTVDCRCPIEELVP